MLKNNSTLIVALGAFSVMLSGAASFAATTDCKNFDQYPEISKQELTDLIHKNQVFVVDVNSSESYKKVHIPTAIRYGDHEKEFAKLLPGDPNKLVVAYCGGTQCTAWEQAAEAACKAHHTNIRHFKPGISGWVAGNQSATETTTTTTKKTDAVTTQ